MKILLVEDDEIKIKNLEGFIMNLSSEIHIELDTRRSYQSGLNAILNKEYDLILLDMSMHNFDKKVNESGGVHMPFAGEDILREMSWNEIPTKALIVTQYDLIGNKLLTELKESWAKNFSDNYIGTVFYRDNETDWQNELSAFIFEHNIK
jgi:CheY-like chemotaxis protein